jgi:hypothetical protein
MRSACGSWPSATAAKTFLAACRACEHSGAAEQHAAGGAAAFVLADPASQCLAASAGAEAIAETGQRLIPHDVVGLAGGQLERGNGIRLQFHRVALVGELVGKP